MSCCRCVGSAFATRRLCARPACSHGRLRSSHLLINHGRLCERVGIQAWAWQCMRRHAWACVGVRGPTPRVRRACDAACLQLRGTRPRQPSAAIPGLRATDTQRSTGASFSSGARGWIMRMGTWRGHTSSVCLISLIGSAQSHQLVDRLGWCPHRAAARSVHQDICT